MILKKLILKNFKSHKNTTIEFNKGITIIVGENGVGKSSILEGITYALFKKSTLNQNDLITLDKNNEQKSTMSVTLLFEENGNEYKVIRTNSLSSSNSKLYKGNKPIAQGNSEVNKELNHIINMDMPPSRWWSPASSARCRSQSNRRPCCSARAGTRA